jgi:hypothetical protein
MATEQHGLDIFPSYIMETTNSDGSRSVSSIYTIDAFLNRYILFILFIIFVGPFLTPFVALICVILYITMLNKAQKIFPILGILICGYLLFDVTHGWYVSKVISMFAHPLEKLYMIRGTVTMLIVNSILLLFGNTLFTLAFRNNLMLFLYVVVITMFVYLIGTHILLNLFPIKFV